MSTDRPESPAVDGEGLRVGLIAARYNFQLVNSLLESTITTLRRAGVAEGDIETVRVPGSNEIPQVVNLLAQTGQFDVMIALGVIIRGQTEHASLIARTTAAGLQDVALREETAVINGILCVDTKEQAEARVSGEYQRGREFAHAALEMARLTSDLQMRFLDDLYGLGEEDDLLDELEDLDDSDDDGPERS
ncbi:MAG: 6,7-dimethyl-8-ribityllumazine synthase [Verrucomicrobia bacterium]|jgi:6,7-dimethyl-8-ribityllumazine synthase|nr:6,7-dimethyl-8-ribityllumazine synthase [Verrucomicrobiota bacterium]